MARKRFDKLAREKQEAILRAAAEEFGREGYEGASINRIIEASGMSKGSVYYYFEDKADLFSTTLERSIQRFVDEIGWLSLEVLGPDEFWDAVLELTRRSVALARRSEWWIRVLRSYHMLRREGSTEAAALRVVEMAREWWRTIISRGQVLGVIRSDLPLELLVETTMGADEAGDRWMMERWDDFSEDELDRIVDGRVDLLRDMLDKENEGWQ
jgi:AcrR family transcriptional regulator